MAGLLDFFNGDDGQQALGLLAAAGPSMQPQNFASRLALAGKTYRDLQTGQIENDLKKAQTSGVLQQQQLEQLQLQQAQEQWKLQQPLLQQIVARMTGGGATFQSSPSQPFSPPSPGGGMGSGTFGMSIGGQPGSAPSSGSGGGTILPGVPDDIAAINIATGGLKGVPTLVNEYNKPTDFQREVTAAGLTGSDARDALRGKVTKDTYIAPTSLRPGGYAQDAKGNIRQMPQVPEGYQAILGADNQFHIVPVDGGVGALQTSTAARTLGKTSGTLTQGTDGNGNPTWVLGVPPGTVGAAGGSPHSSLIQPGDADVAKIYSQQLAQAQARLAAATTPDEQRRAAADIAGITSEMQRSHLAVQPSVVRPANPAGYNASQEVLGKANADRYVAQVNQAADSPTRVNVYDNILNLSKSGVLTGPGQQWKNDIKGLAANTPLLSSVTGGWKDDVSGFQELQKFMYQNAQRSWQAAGGTGTDSQLESFTRANPNDKMFPQALQAMAEWGKAGELALQGKVNAAQQFKDQNGGNVAKMDQFERTWRNNFDPVIFQLKTMEPAKAQAYVENLKKTNPKAYSALMMKASALKNIGGL